MKYWSNNDSSLLPFFSFVPSFLLLVVSWHTSLHIKLLGPALRSIFFEQTLHYHGTDIPLSQFPCYPRDCINFLKVNFLFTFTRLRSYGIEVKTMDSEIILPGSVFSYTVSTVMTLDKKFNLSMPWSYIYKTREITISASLTCCRESMSSGVYSIRTVSAQSTPQKSVTIIFYNDFYF